MNGEKVILIREIIREWIYWRDFHFHDSPQLVTRNSNSLSQSSNTKDRAERSGFYEFHSIAAQNELNALKLENGRVIFKILLKSNKFRKEDSFAAVQFKGCCHWCKGWRMVFYWLCESRARINLLKMDLSSLEK